jgi:hypothetical protein
VRTAYEIVVQYVPTRTKKTYCSNDVVVINSVCYRVLLQGVRYTNKNKSKAKKWVTKSIYYCTENFS